MRKLAFAVSAAIVLGVCVSSASAQGLKTYDSSKKDFWTNPPPDWFLGDETQEQKGLNVPSGPPTGYSEAQILDNLKKIRMAPGFEISLFAPGVLEARQMAWGSKGTLFVGSFLTGNVNAVVDQGGKKVVKTILKGLMMPTGIAFKDGALYVIAVNKLLRYDNAEDNLDRMPEPKVVYDDMPPYPAHGWKYLVADKDGWFYVPFGPPCNVCIPPTSVSQIRRVNPTTGAAEIVALGVRNSVGGDIDPRTGRYWFTENARDWLGDDKPSDKLNVVKRIGEHFGYPYCHQGDMPDPKFALGHECSEFSPPVYKLGNHVAPLGMKFYTGAQFPADWQNSIIVAEHGSWNRHAYNGGRVVRIVASPDGMFQKEDVLATGFIQGERDYIGRPVDILQDKDGSILVSDDWAGAIYRISYKK
jgi:glucose/arabinose dehydrogenase